MIRINYKMNNGFIGGSLKLKGVKSITQLGKKAIGKPVDKPDKKLTKKKHKKHRHRSSSSSSSSDNHDFSHDTKKIAKNA